MILDVIDRNDEYRQAVERAARRAEVDLAASNSNEEREFARDILGNYCTGILKFMEGDPSDLLAWALAVAERDSELHDSRLLEEAWAQVKFDAAQRRWEELGGAGGNPND